MPSFSLEYTENGQPQSFPFDSVSVSIGRDKAADFVLDHPTVSRQHALIVHNQRGFQLVVLSRGGMTAVDGNPISGDVDLFDGNVLHFGQLTFTFRSPEAPAKAASNGSATGTGNFNQPGMGAGGLGQQPIGMQSGMGQQGLGQQTGGFAQQPGAMPGAGGFGQQPGGMPGQGGFGGQQMQQGGPGAGMAGPGQSGGFSAPGGGFGPPGGAPPAEEPAAPDDPNGMVTWDQIANSAEAMGETGGDSQTDFQRIQAAQAKAVEQSKGTNPAIIVGAGVLIVGLLGYTFYPAPESDNTGADVPPEEQPFIRWDDKTTDCIGEADCMKRSERAFAVGVDYIEKQDVELSFLFQGYKNLELADILAEKAGKERPAEYARADAAKKQAREELSLLFKKFQVEYHNSETRKMYRDMAMVIARVKTYFPYKGAREHQWAIARENDMKDRGIYPKNPFGR